MNTELAPKHARKIENNYVLWFECVNSYVIVSEISYQLLVYYLECDDSASFIQQIKKHFGIEENIANSYYTELSDFLINMNSSADHLDASVTNVSIPASNFRYFYSFGDSNIEVNYASQKLLSLMHPNIQHATVKNCGVVTAVFDVFEENKLLYLYKNKLLLCAHNTANFHFLQGKFTMELVTSIYNNEESDWLATFHASTVCNSTEAIMIIGDSGNGKSTLSAILMANGFDLLADDVTPMLAENRQLYRSPSAISIKKGAFPMIAKLYDDFNALESQRSSSKPVNVKYLPPSASFEHSKKHFECHNIVMVKYTSDVTSEFKRCPAEHILQKFIPDSWISPNAYHSELFLNWLNNLNYYELTYSDNDFAVAKFHELFNL